MLWNHKTLGPLIITAWDGQTSYVGVIFQEMSGLYSPVMEAECTVPNVEAPSPAPR